MTSADTTTTDTPYTGVSPSVHRNYNVDTSTTNFTGTVTTGEIVNGRGLAFTNTVPGTFDLNVVNNGTVQIDAGTAATAGGSAALNVTAIGATDVNYSGAGSILNLGTGGNGLNVAMTGTGNFVGTVGGNVTSGPGVGDSNGNAIAIIGTGTAGNITLSTATGTTLRGENSGILVGALNVWLDEYEALIVLHLALGTLLWATTLSLTLQLSPARERARGRAEAVTA